MLLHLDLMVCLYFHPVEVLNGHLTNYASINNNLLFISDDMIMKLKRWNSERSYKKIFFFSSLQTFPSPEQMVQCNLSSRSSPRHSTGTGREHSLRPGTKTLRGWSILSLETLFFATLVATFHSQMPQCLYSGQNQGSLMGKKHCAEMVALEVIANQNITEVLCLLGHSTN